MSIGNDMKFVRVNSHRARKKMFSLIGREACEPYFSWDRWCTGGFYRVPQAELDRVCTITGITRLRKCCDLHRCLEL